jgi:hypothetical protein
LEGRGGRDYNESWESFYRKNGCSSEQHLVKTHEAPVDQGPAFYVVRDARKAIYSYFLFHRRYNPQHPVTLLDLVLGGDIYGDWSSHYESWLKCPNRFLLRYKELISASPDLLNRMATFLGHQGKIEPWQNPFQKLQEEQPTFFREGKFFWERPAEWTDRVDEAFWAIHGDLMRQLGHVKEDEVGRIEYSEDWHSLRTALRQRRDYERHAAFQQKEIERLRSRLSQKSFFRWPRSSRLLSDATANHD